MRRVSFLFFLVAPCLLMAGGWPQIPKDVWAIKEDPAKGITGAVVLEDRISFRNVLIEYTYRVRILSETGKAAAEFEEFPDKAYDIEGRTVYPDGREVVFNQRKDFQTKTAVKSRYSEVNRTLAIPPGITGDCVVELHWKESATSNPNRIIKIPLPSRMGWSHQWILANPYFTKELILEFPTSFPWNYQFFPSRSHAPSREEKGGYQIYTLRDIPAKKEVPYCLDVSRDFPRLLVYWVPFQLRPYMTKGSENLWKGAAWVHYREVFSDSVRKGSAYKALLAELAAGLPDKPQARAYELLLRLNGRIKNTSWPTFDEMASLSKQKAEEEHDRGDLDAVARQGWTDGGGMEILYFNLLNDLKVHPKIAMADDRDYRLFYMDCLDVFQFSRAMMVVEEEGRPPLWLDSTLRFCEPGVIHPDFQGTPCLVVDPKDWSVKRMVVPSQPLALNQSVYIYGLDLKEDAVGFKVEASFRGYPEFRERTRFMSLEPKEQDRKLKEDLERTLKSAEFSRVKVRNAQNARENLSFEAEGQIESEPQRRREIYPFPGMQWPLQVPDEWPDRREDYVVLPFLQGHSATCTFKLPEGYSLGTFTPFEKSNRFGKVFWNLTQDAARKEVKVELRVEVSAMLEKPDSYEEFRTFMGWVQDACGRSIFLEKK